MSTNYLQAVIEELTKREEEKMERLEQKRGPDEREEKGKNLRSCV